VARLDRLYHRIQTVSNDTVTDRGPRRLAAGYTESRWPGLGARALANRVGLPQPVIEPDGQLGWLRQALATQGTHGRRTWRSQRRYRIAVNAAYSQVRRRGRRQREVSWANLPPDLEPASGDDPAEQTELRTVLIAAIDELGAADHTVVVPRDVDGMSHLDIAATLDLSVPPSRPGCTACTCFFADGSVTTWKTSQRGRNQTAAHSILPEEGIGGTDCTGRCAY
jgi:hypothetical protein